MTNATPEPIEPTNSAELDDGGGDNGGENRNSPRERVRSIVRGAFAVILGVLLMADVGLYSLYKALEARVESQDRRLERVNALLTDLLNSRDNASKIEEIEIQVDSIEKQIGIVHQLVKDTRPPTEPPPEDEPAKSKK